MQRPQDPHSSSAAELASAAPQLLLLPPPPKAPTLFPKLKLSVAGPPPLPGNAALGPCSGPLELPLPPSRDGGGAPKCAVALTTSSRSAIDVLCSMTGLGGTYGALACCCALTGEEARALMGERGWAGAEAGVGGARSGEGEG